MTRSRPLAWHGLWGNCPNYPSLRCVCEPPLLFSSLFLKTCLLPCWTDSLRMFSRKWYPNSWNQSMKILLQMFLYLNFLKFLLKVSSMHHTCSTSPCKLTPNIRHCPPPMYMKVLQCAAQLQGRFDQIMRGRLDTLTRHRPQLLCSTWFYIDWNYG